MKRALKIFVAGALILATSALWAIGNHVAGSAQTILMTAIVLAVAGLVIFF